MQTDVICESLEQNPVARRCEREADRGAVGLWLLGGEREREELLGCGC